MNHFPETTAALRRLARSIKESVSLFFEAYELRSIKRRCEDESERLLADQMRGTARNRLYADQWWIAKYYEETEAGEK